MNINIKKIEDGKIPEYKTKGSSGADCYSRIDWIISAGDTMKIPLGFAIEIPMGYEMQIRPRSGLSKDGIIAQLGTIDSDYRGEVSAIITNNTKNDYMVHKYDRICQAVICPVIICNFDEVSDLSDTERGKGGFGSTGKN